MTPRRDRLRLLALLCASALTIPAAASAQDDAKVDAEVSEKTDATGSDKKDGEEEEEDPNAFPLSAKVSLWNGAGSGWLSPGYTMMPTFAQTLTPSIRYRIPELDWLPKMTASTELDVSMQWVSNYYSTVYDRVPRLSDLRAGLSFPSLYKEELTGISLSAGLNARAPLSVASRRWNVLGTLGIGASIGWSTSHLEDLLPEWLGDVSLSYAPSASVAGHLYPNASVPCDAAPLGPTLTRYGSAAENLDRIPLVITRKGEVLPDGTCIIAGRRSIGAFSHTASLGWSYGKHSVNASLGFLYQLLAPLNHTPDLTSPFATAQNWSELSTGSIAYAYEVPMESFDLPVDTSMTLSAGVASLQPSYDLGGRTLRFPFWDFATPANNFSSAFVAIDVGI